VILSNVADENLIMSFSTANSATPNMSQDSHIYDDIVNL
jgi:hypothetical protein